jgi:hypothetical protein
VEASMEPTFSSLPEVAAGTRAKRKKLKNEGKNSFWLRHTGSSSLRAKLFVRCVFTNFLVIEARN